MIFKQHRHQALAQLSYVLGCSRSREAVIVDPNDGIGAEAYVLDTADMGLTIVGVLETHLHADYVSCARELAEMASVPLWLHEVARGIVKYPFEGFADGQTFDIGKVQLRALFTPGHTPEHTSFLVLDRIRSQDPWFVLTGDCLFVGDVGRPDLLVGDAGLDVMDQATRARTQYKSLQRLLTLADYVEVFPGHFGGSSCGGVNMSGKVSSTIGFERQFNIALQQPDAEAFARFVNETARPFPENYARIKACNLGLISKDDLKGVRA